MAAPRSAGCTRPDGSRPATFSRTAPTTELFGAWNQRRSCSRGSGAVAGAAAVRLVEAPIEAMEHLVQDMGAVLMGHHSVGEEDVGGVLGPDTREVVRDHSVQPAVHLA